MDRLLAMACFVRVVETGSFSAVARQLRVGQPAISKTIAGLEDWLGTRLLLRSTRRLMPTDAGQQFFEAARLALAAADTAEQVARHADGALFGRLRVCAPVTFSRLCIVPHLGLFLDIHPGVDIELELDDGNIDLIEGGIDVALRMGSLTDSSLTARRIGRGARMVIATPAFIDRYGAPGTPADLADKPAILYARRNGGRDWIFKRDAEQVAVTLSGRLQCSAAEGVREAVLAGLGLTIGSDWMFQPELATGAVQPLLIDWALPPVDLWAMTPAGRQVSARARAFIDFVEGLMQPAQ